MSNRNKLYCALASCLALPPGAFAQTESRVLEEVIVTANRTSESLQDVPISVTAVDGEALRDIGILNPEDLARIAPTLGVNNPGGSAQATNFAIRGVGTASFQRSIEPSVALIIDEVTLIRPELGIINFTDLAQIEVLNGPQGFLFGKNASAGAVNIRTNDPKIGETSARLFTEYGQLDNANDTSKFRVQGVGNISLSDTAAARINLTYTDNSELLENVVPNPQFGAGIEQTGASAKVLWEPNSQLSILVAGDYLDAEGFGSGIASTRSAPPGTPLADILPPLGVTPGPDNSKSANDAITYYDQSLVGTQIKVTYAFENGFELSNIAAYRSTDIDQAFDADYSPVSVVQFFGGMIETSQSSNELRLTSPVDGAFTYQVGVFALDATVREAIDASASLGLPPIPGFTTTIGSDSFYRQELGSYAVYGQGTYDFTDRLALTVGSRLTHDTVSMQFETTAGGGVIAFLPVTPLTSDSEEETNLSGRATLQYDVNPEWMVYGTIARGYKGPGYSQYSVSYVEPEIPTHFEIGSKMRLLDNTLTLNFAAYDTRFDDFQAQSFDVPTISFTLQNAGELRTRGAELQLIAAPTDRLTLNAGVAYTDARFTTFEGDSCYTGQVDCVDGLTDSSGRRLPNAPEWKAVIDGSYYQPITDDLAAIFNLGVTSQSSVNFLSNGNPASMQDGYTTIDIGASLTSQANNWTLRAFCRNCSDERFIAFGQENLFFPGSNQFFTYSSFRQVGVSFDITL